MRVAQDSRLIRYSDEIEQIFAGRVKQLFLYVTNRCDLRCEQCFYSSELGNVDMRIETAKFHLENFARLGADRLTLLGGEPTLYDFSSRWRSLNDLVDYGLRQNYKNIRIDTNGQFDSEFLKVLVRSPSIELSFSLDGISREPNDKLRGDGVFEKCIMNLSIASRLFRSSITICVSRHNIDQLIATIPSMESFQLESINFHPLLFVGNAQDLQIRTSAITQDQWLNFYPQLKALAASMPKTKFRIPPRFRPLGRGDERHYCSIKLADRAHVQPNGEIRICPLHVGTKVRVGHASRGELVLSQTHQELDLARNIKICPAQGSKSNGFEELCVSFKPEAT